MLQLFSESAPMSALDLIGGLASPETKLRQKTILQIKKRDKSHFPMSLSLYTRLLVPGDRDRPGTLIYVVTVETSRPG
jgi:hypothetical protein